MKRIKRKNNVDIRSKVLNLGCGKTRIPNSIGIDKIKINGYVDIVWDLNKTPYPFKKNNFEKIYIYHVLEHLNDPLVVFKEVYRLLRPEGSVYLKVPHFSSMGAFTDLTHKRPFGYLSFDCLEENNYQNFYSNINFKIISKRIKYFGLYPNDSFYQKFVHKNSCPVLLKPIVRVIDFLINISPTFFERVWCYWVGGATEIDLTLQKE